MGLFICFQKLIDRDFSGQKRTDPVFEKFLRMYQPFIVQLLVKRFDMLQRIEHNLIWKFQVKGSKQVLNLLFGFQIKMIWLY